MTLRQAGWSWQLDRTWCETGKVKRKRKGEIVEVTEVVLEELELSDESSEKS